MAVIFLPLSSNSQDFPMPHFAVQVDLPCEISSITMSPDFWSIFQTRSSLTSTLLFVISSCQDPLKFGLATGSCHPEIGSVRQNGIASPIRRNITTSGPAPLQDD